jgi:hypothetical protein
LVAALLIALLAACSDDDGDADERPEGTVPPTTEEQALETYLLEMENVGWFSRDDDVEIETEYLLIADAQQRTSELGLSLYATLPGPPPYPDGLPGWYIVARGDFNDVTFPETPGPDTKRRPAVSTAFVDLEGRLTYGMKFTDVTPSPTPEE